jgi:predicted O-methyltransferase YrrM
MIPFGLDENIKIDKAHAMLLTGLVKAQKPTAILEMGVGGGRSLDGILEGLEYNQQPYDYTLVDNFLDFQYEIPHELPERYGDRIKIVKSDEKDYVLNCDKKFDFIMSDADHYHTQEWFEHVYDNLLNDGGILVYHDVNVFDSNAFKNLLEILDKCKEQKKSHMLFNKSSLPEEQCKRGLLVIFKN